MTTTTAANPLDPAWATLRLASLAARAAAGEDHDTLRDELFDEVWPWATDLAERLAERLPAGADRDTTRSEIVLAVWQATQRISWEQPQAWRMLLRQRISGARVDAARRDDSLSRRLRRASHDLAGEVAAAEQRLCRHLTGAEQDQLATALWPNSRREWLQAMRDGGVSSSQWTLSSAPQTPDEVVIHDERCAAVRAWVGKLPEQLARDVVVWLDQPRPHLPARLRRRLEPHLCELAALTSDEALREGPSRSRQAVA